jgi:L-alanine-DL-glutamate epimerase-like enolase superfamily enzyme
MRIEHDISLVHTTHPFIIARGGTSDHRLIRVRIIDDDGLEGWGEAAPNRFYGETPDTVLAALARLAPIVEQWNPWLLDDIEAEMNRALRFNGSVKSAISAAGIAYRVLLMPAAPK